jgi:uncharacterized protein YcfL
MKIFTYLGLSILFFSAILALNGCATTSGISASAVVVKGPEAYMQESKIIIDNDTLSRAIDVKGLKSIFVGDLLKANVMLHSKRTNTITLQYKFRWYNSESIEIAPEFSSWKPIIMYGRELISIQAVAPNPSAKEFKIEIRYQD